MAIALRSSNGYIEYNSGSSSTSHTIDISDAAVGDVRFICANWSPDGTGNLPSHPSITGWTQIGTSTATGAASDSRLSLYYRVVQSGDTLTSATVGVTLDQTAYAIVNSFTLEGVDTGSVLDQTTPAMNTGSATTQPCPAITTTTDGAWVVHVAIQDGSSNMADGDEPGTDTLLGTQYGNPPSNGASIGCSYVVEASAGSSPSASWNTGVSEEYVGATFAVSPSSSASVSPTDIDMDESSVTLTGTGFDASGNTVYLSDQNTTGSFYEVDVSSAIDTEGTTEITLDLTDLSSSELAQLHELGPGTRYFIVDAAGGEVPSEEVALHRPEAFVMSLSSNFAPGSTTAQLTAPSGKTTGDMDGGRIEEAANPSATTTNVTTDDYREDEWCFAQKTLARKVAYEFRATIAGSEYDTYSETPALDLTEESNAKVRVVPFSTTTGTGTLDITDADFGTAKFALMFLSWADGLDAVDDNYRLSIGSTDGTDTRSVSVAADDNASSDNITYRYLNNSTYMGVIGNGTGTEQIRIEFDSWITDGIRVDVTLNSVSRACRGFVVLFGGSDFSFSFDAVSMNGTNTVNVTAPGFEPDALILSSQNNSTSLVTSHLTFGSAVNVGIADATSRMSPQAGIRHSSQDGTTPTNVRTWIDHQDIGGSFPSVGGAVRLSAIDFDSSGYSLAPGGNLGTDVEHVIAIGTAGKVPFAIAHFTNPASASVDWEVTDGSITPQCVIGVMTAAPNLDSANTEPDQHAKTFFAFDKDGNQACVGIAEDDAVSPSNTCVFASTNNAIWMRNDDQSGDFYLLGDPTIIPGGFRFPASEITTANATTRYGWALIIGDVITPSSIDRTASVTATGAATSTREVERPRTVSVAATGTVAATGVREVSRTRSVTATGTVAVSSQREVPRTASVTATATVTATAEFQGIISRTSSVTATGIATTTTYSEKPRPASVTATGTVTVTRAIDRPRTASVTATGVITGARDVERPRTASVTATGTVTAARTIERARIPSVSATGAVSSSSFLERFRVATVTATGTVDVSYQTSGGVVRTASVAATGAVTATRLVDRPRPASVTATGTVIASRTVEKPRTAGAIAAGTVTATRTIERTRVSMASASGTIDVSRSVEKIRTSSTLGVGSVVVTRFAERYRTAAVSALGSVDVTTEAAGQISRSSSVSASGTVTASRGVERLRVASVIANGSVIVGRTREVPRTGTITAEGTVTSLRSFAFLRGATTQAFGSVDVAYFIGEPSAISDIIVGRQMIARSTDTAFPIEAAVSEGGGVTGLSIDISIRDANAPTYYLDFNDNTMKTSGWTSKTKALSEYGSGFYGTTINVSTISGLSENHLSVEYDISGASVGITNSIVSIEDYGLTSTQDTNLSTILGELVNIEAGYDHSELMRGILAMVANKLSGAAAGSTGTAAIRDIADTKDRITIGFDENGNRTSSTINDLT